MLAAVIPDIGSPSRLAARGPISSTDMIDLPDRQLVVLVANHAEWLGRSLASVVEAHGYGVLRAVDGNHAHELALEAAPDVVILDAALPGMSGIQVCRALVGTPTFDATIPIVITTPGPASNRDRAEAYNAGAWEVCSSPIDTETLLVKLARFVCARRRVRLVESCTSSGNHPMSAACRPLPADAG